MESKQIRIEKNDETISLGIAKFARDNGITADQISLVEILGEGENQIKVYKLPLPGSDGCTQRVAETNGDPVWEENDPAAFAELLESLA